MAAVRRLRDDARERKESVREVEKSAGESVAAAALALQVSMEEQERKKREAEERRKKAEAEEKTRREGDRIKSETEVEAKQREAQVPIRFECHHFHLCYIQLSYSRCERKTNCVRRPRHVWSKKYVNECWQRNGSVWQIWRHGSRGRSSRASRLSSG